MKLQAAIDRKPLNETLEMAKKLDSVVDIVELGTSVVKDYGLTTLEENPLKMNHSELLYDIKTSDEGEYEFAKGFDAGADILTVMASSSIPTIHQVYDLTMKRNKKIFIDLLETDDERIAKIADLENAIFGLHHSKDAGAGFDAVGSVKEFHDKFPQIKHIAVAGGIDLDQAKKLAEQGIAEIAIVGGKISGADDPIESAKKFMEAIK